MTMGVDEIHKPFTLSQTMQQVAFQSDKKTFYESSISNAVIYVKKILDGTQ